MSDERVMVKITKNSWHYKLQKFILGSNMPTLYNLCPYFWLTIFCILISPIVLIFKGLSELGHLYDKYIQEPLFLKWVNSLDETNFYGLYYGFNSTPFRLYASSKEQAASIWARKRGMSLDKNAGDDYDAFLVFLERARKKYYENDDKIQAEAKAKRDAIKKRKEERAQRVKNFKAKLFNVQGNIAGIVKWTKRITGLLITSALATVLYFILGWIGQGIYYLITHAVEFDWSGFLSFMGFLCVVVILFLLAITYIDHLKRRYQIDGYLPFYLKSILFLGTWFIWNPIFYLIWKPVKFLSLGVYYGIINFGNVFKEYFGAAYGDYCPGLEIEDEE